MRLRPQIGLMSLMGSLVIAAPSLAQDGEQPPPVPPAAEPATESAGSAEEEGEEPPTGEESPAGELVEGLDEDAWKAYSEFQKELFEVEQDVNGLKERVFNSKATLLLLKELVIEGATVGSRVSVWHVNKMGRAYSMESAQYFIDGTNVYSVSDPSGSLDEQREFEVHQQALPPGEHSLQVNLVLRGRGLGVFSYLEAYSFKVQSSYKFRVADDKMTIVRVIADEKGGPFVDFTDRPDVQYEETLEDLREE